jgi:prevent-host-death family protein
MAQFNVHEAKTHFSRLLDRALEGEEIVITRNGIPVAELVPARQCGLTVGDARHDPNVDVAALQNDSWWQPMTDEEVDAFINGGS